MPRTPLPRELVSTPFRVGDALGLGVSPRRLRGSDLHAPFRGVRAVGAPDSLKARCRALLPLMHPHQYFSHTTAALLWSLPLPRDLEDDVRLHVTHAGGRAPIRQGVVAHQAATRRDVLLVGGIPASSPTDAWCELASLQRPRAITVDELVVAGDRLLGWPTPIALVGEIDASLAQFGQARGIRMLRRARRELRAGSGSPRETQLRLSLRREQPLLPEPELNGAICLSTGAIVYGDLVFRQYRVAVEYDGGQHRTDERQFLRDVDRLNDLAHDGWRVIRAHRGTPVSVTLHLVAAALRARGWSPERRSGSPNYAHLSLIEPKRDNFA